MNSSGTNGDSSVQNAASGRACARHPVAERAVADLIVVLAVDDEPLRRDVVGRGAEAPAPKRRVAAVVDVRAVDRLGQLPTAAEVRVVAVAVAGQHASAASGESRRTRRRRSRSRRAAGPRITIGSLRPDSAITYARCDRARARAGRRPPRCARRSSRRSRGSRRAAARRRRSRGSSPRRSGRPIRAPGRSRGRRS